MQITVAAVNLPFMTVIVGVAVGITVFMLMVVVMIVIMTMIMLVCVMMIMGVIMFVYMIVTVILRVMMRMAMVVIMRLTLHARFAFTASANRTHDSSPQPDYGLFHLEFFDPHLIPSGQCPLITAATGTWIVERIQRYRFTALHTPGLTRHFNNLQCRAIGNPAFNHCVETEAQAVDLHMGKPADFQYDGLHAMITLLVCILFEDLHHTLGKGHLMHG